MGLLNLFTRSRREERAMVPLADLPFSSYSLFGFSGGSTIEDVGVEVTPDTAMAASAIFSAVSIIANTIAGLPLHLRDRRDGGKVTDHPLARLIRSPNENMTPFSFWETTLVDLLTRGNLYAYIDRDGGDVSSMYPLPAASLAPGVKNGQLLYGVHGLGGGYTLTPDQVLHVPHMPDRGIIGRSPITIARQSVGLTLALEKFAGKFFANGCLTGGILELPAMSKEAREAFVTQLRDMQGLARAHEQMVPSAPGLKFHRTQANAEESQVMAARTHQVREAARIYRVPPHMLGDLEKASYASIEAQGIDFMQRTIAPWTIRIEQELTRKLIREGEQDRLELKFNLDALLRATTTERYAAHSSAVGGPFMSVNEARRLEGLQPIAGGDSVLSPLNSAPTDTRVAGLLDDAARRLLVKEVNAITRAAKKHEADPAALKRWASEFYGEHLQLAASTFTPALRFVPNTPDPDGVAARYVTEQRSALIDAIDAGTVPQLVERFSFERMAEVTAGLLKKV